MTANTTPIFTATPDLSYNGTSGMGVTLVAAAADFTGAGANNLLVHTAGANGSYVRRLRFKPTGTNAITVARVFINNGSANSTATNNTFYGEVSLPATSLSNNTANADVDYVMELALPAGFKIYVGLGTAATTGWTVICVAGQY